MTRLVACVTIPHAYIGLAQRQDPSVATRPLAVASAASERAQIIDVCPRAADYGVRRGMAPADARARCRTLAITPLARLPTAPFTAEVEQALLAHSDVVEQAAFGTWLVELLALGPQFRAAQRSVAQLQQALIAATALTWRSGAATNALVASVAARRATHAPLIVLPGHEAAFLAPLPVRWLPGVGPQTAGTLGRLGITRIGQLAQLSESQARTLLGAAGPALRLRAQGQPVQPARAQPQALIEQRAFAGEPCADPEQLRAEARLLTGRAGRALRVRQAAAGSVTVSVTWLDGTTARHRHQLVPRATLDSDLARGSRIALDWLLGQRRLAVTGLVVELSDLGVVQPDLLSVADPRPLQRQQAIDTITQRHGTGAIVVAWLLKHLRRAA